MATGIGDFGSHAGRLLVVAGLLVAGLAAWSWRLPQVRGTTLVAPWCWSLVVLVSLAASEILIGISGSPVPAWAAHLRFAAAMTTFCPVMAVLGAKRPQNLGWQFVVFSLLAILCLPILEWLLFGGRSEIHPARFWFLAILIALGALNAVGTRHWLSSLLYCAGQVMLISPFFSAQGLLSQSPAAIAGLAVLVLAWVTIAAQMPRPQPAATPLDRVWLDFRDAFGVVWAWRVADRMNASASMYDWPVMLSWRGFRRSGATGGLPTGVDTKEAIAWEIPQSVEESLRTLLRRFVSSHWIDARLALQARQADAEVPAA
jgi:hypothetical protein